MRSAALAFSMASTACCKTSKNVVLYCIILYCTVCYYPNNSVKRQEVKKAHAFVSYAQRRDSLSQNNGIIRLEVS